MQQFPNIAVIFNMHILNSKKYMYILESLTILMIAKNEWHILKLLTSDGIVNILCFIY